MNRRHWSLIPFLLDAARLLVAAGLVFSSMPAPVVFAKEFGVVEDLYVGRNVISPFGGFGRYENLLKYSEQLDNAAWVKSTNATVTPNAATAPDGTNSADQVAFGTPPTPIPNVTQHVDVTPAANKTWVGSVWAKTVSGTATLLLRLESQNLGNIAQAPVTVTTDWQRFSVTGTATAAQTGNVGLQLRNDESATLLFYGAQLEEAGTAGVYARTTATTVAANRGLTVVGKTTLLGDVDLGDTSANTVRIKRTVKGSSPTLVVDQETTADIADFRDTGVSVFKIADGGVITATGPLTVSGSAYLATASGAVGIGTTDATPGYKLILQKSDPGIATQLFLWNPSAAGDSGSRIGFYNVNGVGALVSAAIDGTRSAIDEQGDLIFRTVRTGPVLTEAMRIRAGNVGIGTTSPGGKLEVYDTAGPVARLMRSGTTFGVSLKARGSAENNEYLDIGATHSTGAPESNVAMSIGNGQSGIRVGIGTTSPLAKLEVAGPTRAKDAIAFHIYSTATTKGKRIVAKWTGSATRTYKFWVDDTVSNDTCWNVLFRDNDANGYWTQWTSQTGGPLLGLGTSEAAALVTSSDGGILYFNRDTNTLTTSNCANCTGVLAYEYNNVIPLVAGDFVRPVDAKFQGPGASYATYAP